MHPSILQPATADPQVHRAIEKYGRDPEVLLPVLRMLASKPGGLDRDTIANVSRSLELSTQRLQGVASFYSLLSTAPATGRTIRVCDGIPCWLKGAAECRRALESKLSPGGDWTVCRSSCLGLCDRAPAALVEADQCGPLNPQNAAGLIDGYRGEAASYAVPRDGESRLLLTRTGRIDPWSIDEAIGAGAYRALEIALARSPDEVIAEIERSGLRGRGGAGFPTGRKWRMVAESTEERKFVVCNADESEPLIFKDRVLMETDPHAVIEGTILAGYAAGASTGVIYIRGEYEPQAVLLEHAIRQATERGWLGERIAGTDFSFHLHVHRGAGAYICGEESALLESLEGRRGEPRVRPPYPAQVGYRGLPTLVNNVETLAACAAIMTNGADVYRSLGRADCPGTRLVTVLGHVKQPGLIEVPTGLTLREFIDTFGGGMRAGSNFKLALTGGAAGNIVSSEHLDRPLDHSSPAHGPVMGAGGILVCDESVSAVELVRQAMHFFEMESCGKCTPCRVGTAVAGQILAKLLQNHGNPSDLNHLRRLARSLKTTSMCGLGTSAADPLSSAMLHFGHEFEALLS